MQKHWVYKLSIEQIALIFEVGDLSCFGRNSKKKYSEFIIEYSELFNSGAGIKSINLDRSILRLSTKIGRLKAIYDVLSHTKGNNSMREFNRIFKRQYEGKDDLILITNEINRLSDKIAIIKPVNNSKKDGLSFSELVVIVELSRDIPISNDTKLSKFKDMYDIELKKLNNDGH